MDRAKYIVYKSDYGLLMQVFPAVIQHHKMAEALNLNPDQLVSAGFVKHCFFSKKLVCHGESISLGLESRHERDTDLLRKMLEA